ncbi:MAG TPA: hypothetical protein VLA34_01045, partial [Candidatus Krumholzibacterium sp.]|nr:hypothetical protein [Candidatus Krumholzibacterium sp.]
GDRYEALAGRVICVQPEWGEKVSREIGGVQAAFFHANHAEAENPYQTLETIFEIDGIRFLHLADVMPLSSEEYIRKALEGERIDVAFLDRFFLEDSVGTLLVDEVIRPEHIIVMHLRAGEEAPAYETLKEAYPGIIVFRGQLERRLFR